MSSAARRREPGAPDPYPSRREQAHGWLERLDPVVHGGPDAPGPLSRSQLRAFDERGFLQLEGLFSEVEVQALVAELERLAVHHSGCDPESLILEPGSEELRSVFAVHEQSPPFGRLARDSRLVSAARQILADEVYVHQSRLNYKPGLGGREFWWHSDFETWHVEDGMPRMRALSATIALTPNFATNGPLMLVPGSHRVFVPCAGRTPENHYRRSLRKQEYGVPDAESLARIIGQGGIHSALGPAGSVVLFDCNTLHGSASNITPWPRSNAFVVYNAWGNRLTAPFGAARPRPWFVATREPTRALEATRGALA